MKITYSPKFKKSYKKLFDNEKLAIKNAVSKLSKEPLLGDLKKGDLVWLRVYKIKIKTHEFLIGYSFDGNNLILYSLGTHENFYRNLKR